MLNKPNKNRGGFTLVEIMIVVAIIALLASVAVPSFLRARKRSQATAVKEDLRMVQAAIDQFQIEKSKNGSSFNTGGPNNWTVTDLAPYVKAGTVLQKGLEAGTPLDALGNYINVYSTGQDEVRPFLNPTTYEALSDVADLDFWAPYTPDT